MRSHRAAFLVVDGFVLGYLLDRFAYPVAKLEAAKGNCLMGNLLYAAQAILVDRHSAEGKKGAMQAIISEGPSEDKWRHVYLFPEGTCTNRKSLINFKVGSCGRQARAAGGVKLGAKCKFQPRMDCGRAKQAVVGI